MISEQKVEFFNSQSSFESQSSLSSSRYFDLTNQIAQDTQNIFYTLKKQFLPTEQLTNYERIGYLINRARIINNDTIYQHLEYLDRISAPKQSKQSCRKNQQQLKKLLNDFQFLKKNQMTHKQFYNLYGRNNQNFLTFKKPTTNESNQHLDQDVIQLNEPLSSRLNYPEPKKFGNQIISSQKISINTKDRDLKQLQQQITRLKKNQQDHKKQTDQLILNERINCQKRIKNIFQMLNPKVAIPQSQLQIFNAYKNEIIISKNSLQSTLQQKKQQNEKTQQLQQRISFLQRLNQSLQQQLNGLRKLQNSRMLQVDDMNHSFHSQNNQDNLHQSRRQTQTIKRLTGQRDILRSQLNKQRQYMHSDKFNKSMEKDKEVLRLKRYLEQRNKEYQEVVRSLDKAKVQFIQLNQENRNFKKQLLSIRENSQLKSQNGYHAPLKSTKLIDKNQNQSVLDNSKNSLNKIAVFNDYQGQGIQGYPYFELLSKQFKIRFKRACLKEKQLLYKANSLQIGVISKYIAPNCIQMSIHITNYSQKDITNLKLKAINPNQNKIQYQFQDLKVLQPNKQLKIPISGLLKTYPMGPFVLLLDYTCQTKIDLRLLLPVHIFKCVQITPYQNKLINPTTFRIKPQKKICKDIQTLNGIFNMRGKGDIRVRIRHQHSASTLGLNAWMDKEEVQVEYQHIEGSNHFTEYFIKTFKMILQKVT